ncbi:MAG: MATE family efflux transporter, partial [Eubacterium sp.]|nr:MATE family efflux transporter [Eubacterium sp.]
MGKLSKFIGNKAFYKMVLLIAVPIMIQNGITNFVSLLDNIMIGQIGTEQMSGVAIVNQLIFVYNLCIFGGVSGAGIFTAQFFGQKNDEGVRQTMRFKLWMTMAITIFT